MKPVPDGVPAVMPMLVCREAATAIDFCKTVFGAVELNRRPGPEGTVSHALLAIHGAKFMIEGEWPGIASRPPDADGSSPVVMYVYVDDVDAAVGRAVAVGARILMPVEDRFWGDRTGRIVDPGGHVWTVASRIEETSAGERESRWSDLLND